MAFCSVNQVMPKTAEGTQCPTAPVQMITVPIKSHCGCVIGYETRQPKPGERGFLQCRCAEKKASETQTVSEQKNFAYEGLPPVFVELELPVTGPRGWEIPAYECHLSNLPTPPLTPPPPSALATHPIVV